MRHPPIPLRLRTAVRKVADALLSPWGLSIGALPLMERARRTTYRGALEHAKSVGLAPRTVIDVGVARGTLPLYEAFPTAHLVLVEPVVEARPYIEAISSRFPAVEHVMAAAAARSGSVVLNVHRDIERSSRHWESDYVSSGVTQRTVPAVTIDEVTRDRGLAAPFLMKIDVQGGELDVLEGAQATLEATEYVILEASLFEFFHRGPLLADVVRYLSDRDFVMYDILDIHYRPLDGAVSQIDAAFVKSNSELRRQHRFQLDPLP